MKEAVICLVFYIGMLALMSFKDKETPQAPPSTVCVEHKAPKRGDETPPAISKDCSPQPAATPKAPKVEK